MSEVFKKNLFEALLWLILIKIKLPMYDTQSFLELT